MAKHNIKKLTGASLGAVLAIGATFVGVNLANPSVAEAAHSFSGSAIFAWNCGGNLCTKEITGLNSASEAATEGFRYVTYDTNYLLASSITDGSNTFSLGDDYYWIWSDHAGTLASMTTWSDLTTYIDNIDDYDDFKEFAIDPTGASDGNNSVSTNGDRNFRATIYADGAYFISNASSPADLDYYPSFWDPGMFNPAQDVSGTTANNPAIIQSFLLEPNVTLRSDAISSPITGVTVASSGIPSDAITITANATDSSYNIKFNSNYYDDVTFRVTSASGTYYVRILRTVVSDPSRDDGSVNLYTPSGDTNTYSIRANYTFADGTTRRYTLTPATYVCDEFANPNPSEVCPGGKRLTFKHYVLPTSAASAVQVESNANPPVSVDYTTILAGSTTATYQGTLAGSGKGTHYTIDEWGVYNLGN